MKFIALNGGNSVGASCYYLKCNDINILFDCGLGYDTYKNLIQPNVALLLSSSIESYLEINYIFLSHAHYDHIGDLIRIANLCKNAIIYATGITKTLTEFSLKYNKLYEYDDDFRNVIDRIKIVSYNKMIHNIDGVSFYTFKAGHILGASMFFLNIRGTTILYTGDFSTEITHLTRGYSLLSPNKMKIDLAIICGLHSKDKNYSRNSLVLERYIQDINLNLAKGNNIYISTRQLTKGIECLDFINNLIYNKKLPYKNIVLNEADYNICEKLEQFNINLIRGNVLNQINVDHKNAIYINVKPKYPYSTIKLDFSIHMEYTELVDFIERYNPKNCIIVHFLDNCRMECLKYDFSNKKIVYAKNFQTIEVE